MDKEIYGNNGLVFRKPYNKDINNLTSYFSKLNLRSCDFSIGGIFIWDELFDYYIAEYRDALIIKGFLPDRNIHLFYCPMQFEYSEEIIRALSDYCLKNKIKGYIVNIEERIAENDLNFNEEESENKLLPEFIEYLYPIEKFCDFPGKKMEKKRNHLHYFINNYSPFEIEIINEVNVDDLIKFTDKFKSEHEDTAMAEYECRNLIKTLRNYKKYPYEGILIRKDREIIGYSFGEKIGDTFIIHAEKSNIKLRGAYQVVASEMAKYIKDKYNDVRYLNREDDMGYESLRKSKMSYHPTLFLYKSIKCLQ